MNMSIPAYGFPGLLPGFTFEADGADEDRGGAGVLRCMIAPSESEDPERVS
jgi:hypothetical protein